MFYDKFVALCEERNEKPSPILKKLGLSSGNLKRWEAGATVTLNTVERIADYFGVSLDHFAENGRDDLMCLSKNERTLLVYFRKIPEDKQAVIMQVFNMLLSLTKNDTTNKN